MRFNRNLLVTCIIFLIPVVIILPTAGQFHYTPGSAYSDIAITHYPNMLFIQKTIKETGTIPLWNPYILSGYPFNADPLSGLWYPPGWIALLLPLPFGINLDVILHILFGGWGVFLFLQRMKYNQIISLFGAGVFLLLPKIYAHFGAGHITYLYAFTLTPWLFWAAIRLVKKPYLLEGLLISGMILADVRWVPYGIMGWLVVSWINWRENHVNKERLLQLITKKIVAMTLALLLSAPLLLPFLQYTILSTRSLLTTGDNLFLSLPTANLLGIFSPSYGGTAEWAFYCGAGITLIALLSLFSNHKNWVYAWLNIWLFCLLWSLGSNLPGLSIIAGLPGFNLLRVPPRAMFLGNLAIIFLAAEGIRWIGSIESNNNWKKVRLSFVGVTLFCILIAIMTMAIVGEKAISFQFGAVIILICAIALELWNQHKPYAKTIIAIALIISACDLIVADYRNFDTHEKDLMIPTSAMQMLSNKNQSTRIYSPSYSVSQEMAMEQGWMVTEGIHPMQLKNYVEYFEKASGVKANHYSVVQPPLATGNPEVDNIDAKPDLDRLARLNVAIIASNYPIESIDENEIYSDKELWLYLNPKFSEFPIKVKEKGRIDKVKTIQYTPNRIVYQTDGDAGQILTSEINYPGWIAYDNGVEITLLNSKELFRSVEISSGKHQIEFKYQPILTYIGSGIALITLLFIYIYRRIKL